MYTPPDLVNFPDWDDKTWGGGSGDGLYVMLVVPEPENTDFGCSVETSVAVVTARMIGYDAGVDVPDGLWEPWDYNEQRKYWAAEQKVAKRAMDEGDRDVAQWAVRTYSPYQVSVPVLAAVHAGTHHALLSRDKKHHWYATEADLTDAGRAVWASLKAAFGIEPVLATFLDT